MQVRLFWDLLRLSWFVGGREELLPRLFGRSAEPCTTYASFVECFANDFLRAASVMIALVTSKYFMVAIEALHTVVTKVSHEGGRLLMSSIALNSSSIVVPWAEI